MIQVVKADDQYGSQLFQWDTVNQIISLPHGKMIWFLQLGDDEQFKVVERKPKLKRAK